jgi:hypothetical protein
MLEFFVYDHLPPHLQEVSKAFFGLADWLRQNIPVNEERDFAFRKLLEAKDCAVRAKLLGPQKWINDPEAA